MKHSELQNDTFITKRKKVIMSITRNINESNFKLATSKHFSYTYVRTIK